MPDYLYEKQFTEQGYNLICGVDEAGRGPLAGPVFAAAVILPIDCEIEGLNDSKKLSEKKRELLFDVIKEKAVAYSIASASVDEIEQFNILKATFLAMNRAISGLNIKSDFAIIDGNRVPDNITVECDTLVKVDSKSMSVAASSVIAKVARDRLLLEYDEKYPQYNFKKHKGYGTKEHYEAIAQHGICEVHRKSFLKGVL